MRIPIIKSLVFPYRSLPWFILGILVISFGIVLADLGFYWDDWETVLVGRLFSTTEYWSYFSSNRPLAAWTYSVFAPILGFAPLSWQIFSLVLRWLTACALFGVCLILWPEQKKEAAAVALLFSVYPVFTQQAISMSYHHHWMQYFLYFTTVAVMLLLTGLREKRSTYGIQDAEKLFRVRIFVHGIVSLLEKKPLFLVATGLNLFLMFLNLGISEYFVAMELVRPLLVYLVLSQSIHPQNENKSVKWMRWVDLKRAGKALLYSLPYLGLLFFFSIWRVGFGATDGGAPNQIVLFRDFISAPFATLIKLIQIILQDVSLFLFTSCDPVLDAAALDLSNRFFVLAWGVGLVVAAASAFYLLRLDLGRPQSLPVGSGKTWMLQAALLGSLIVVLGPLPIWITGKQASQGMFSNRFALTAMTGASLLWVVGLSWFSRSWKNTAIVMAILLGLGSAFHLRTLNSYRWSWTRQERFHWQVFWRAPSIQSGTLLVGDGDILMFNRPVPSLNVLYAKPDQSRQMALWYLTSDDYTDILANGATFSSNMREFPFTAAMGDTLMVHYPATSCVWFIRPEDTNHPDLPQSLKELQGQINLTRIQAARSSENYPPLDVFGPEPDHSWCYLFQKADLARQFTDWNMVVKLGDEAIAKKYNRSSSPYEWLPFIEGYARLSQWERAVSISQENLQRDPRYRLMYCALWKKLDKEIRPPQNLQNPLSEILNNLGCTQ